MFSDYQLFFGFPLDALFLGKLRCVTPILKSSFIQDHPDYLQQIDYKGQLYLGKKINSPISFSSLETLEANIYSLLQRLVADYPYKSYPLTLLVIPV